MALPPCLVLTAGLGTRARPLSRLRAKPAFPVAGVPLVRLILAKLVSAGVSRVVLNLHHLAGSVLSAVGDAGDFGLEVQYSREDPALGSAGGPRRALPLLASRRALLVNGDTLTDLDIGALHAAHDASGALVTLSLILNPAPHRYGGVLLDEAGAVTGFVPRNWPERTWHFIGAQVVETAAFECLSPDRPSESITGLYPELMRARPGSVRGFTCDAVFRDIGTPADYLSTSLDLAAGDQGALVGPGCRIHADALVARSVLWEDVEVGAGARLEECIVTDGANVPAGSRFRRRILMPRSRAGAIPPEDGAVTCGDLLVFQVEEEPAPQRGTTKDEGR